MSHLPVMRQGMMWRTEYVRSARIDRSIFNNAHAALVLPAIAPGARVVVRGLAEEPIVLVVPEELARARVVVGEREWLASGEIDGVFFFADARRLVVTQRVRFRYSYREHEVRTTELSLSPKARSEAA